MVSFTLAAMLAFVTACSGGGGNSGQSTAPASTQAGSTTSASPETQKEITLTVFSMLANYAGEQPGWFAKILKDKFNVKLNIIASNLAGGEQKIATMMAAGDLGDLVVFGTNGKDYQDAIKAGLLLDWNKDGLLQKYGQDILKYAGTAIDANKKQFGGGTAVYGVGHEVGSGDGPSEGVEMTFGPDLRWDLYQKLGSPPIKTINDYLPVLKKMQELEPKSESGRPTYGFSLWGDWDSSYMTLVKVIAQLYGYSAGDGFNPQQLTLFPVNGEQKYQGMIDDNSYYMQGLKFYYDANQMGLLDPESLTQKFDDVTNKFKDGQVFFSLFPWVDGNYNTPAHLDQGKGIALVPFQDEKINAYGFNPYGGGRPWAIGSKSKDPARVMQVINYLFSPDGIMESNWGPKGVTWDIDKDGKPFLTPLGKKALSDGSVQMPAEAGGGTFKDGQNQINNATMHLSMVNPNTGEPYNYKLWKSVLNDNPDPVTKSWREKMGALTPKDYFVKNNMLAISKAIFTGSAPETAPADIQQKINNIGKVIKEYSWKMIYAKNEAEYNKLKQEMVTKAKGLGYDDAVAWEVDLAKRTVWAAAKK
jgi:putative aldouronate transport system substrate-binding protein